MSSLYGDNQWIVSAGEFSSQNVKLSSSKQTTGNKDQS